MEPSRRRSALGARVHGSADWQSLLLPDLADAHTREPTFLSSAASAVLGTSQAPMDYNFRRSASAVGSFGQDRDRPAPSASAERKRKRKILSPKKEEEKE